MAAIKVLHIKNRTLKYELLPNDIDILIYEYVNGRFNKTLRIREPELNEYVKAVVINGK